MMDVGFEEAVAQIKEQTGLSLAEIQSRVQVKLTQLAGLVSRDGAIHILANELGVQFKQIKQVGTAAKIAHITLNHRNITVVGRVVQKYEAKSFAKNGREGRVASLLLGDETGVTRLVFWNDQVDAFNELQPEDVLIVQNPFVKQSMMKDRLELQLNTQSTITVNPEGVVVERKQFASQRPPAVQKYIKDLESNEENVELIATVVQVYDPRFFDSCPQCNKKLIAENQCGEHGEVVPVLNFSMSAFLDDGTGNIRATFWKQQSLRLTAKTEAEYAQYKENPTSFEEAKNDLLGEFVKVTGKVKRNDQFDRLEFTANTVTMDIDPAKELQNLQQKFEQQKPAKEEEISVIQDDVVSLDDLEDVG